MHVILAHYVIKPIVMVVFQPVLNLCYEFVELCYEFVESEIW